MLDVILHARSPIVHSAHLRVLFGRSGLRSLVRVSNLFVRFKRYVNGWQRSVNLVTYSSSVIVEVSVDSS